MPNRQAQTYLNFFHYTRNNHRFMLINIIVSVLALTNLITSVLNINNNINANNNNNNQVGQPFY